MRAPKTGKLVAWAVKLGKPNKTERNTFGSPDFFGNKQYGKEPTARIGVLVPKKKGNYKLVRQSPTVQLGQATGEMHYITLNTPLKIKKGQILALTTPTWVPALGHHRVRAAFELAREPRREEVRAMARRSRRGRRRRSGPSATTAASSRPASCTGATTSPASS